jgi:hypothetical protein
MFNVTAEPWTCMCLVVISSLNSDSSRNANIQFGPHREQSVRFYYKDQPVTAIKQMVGVSLSTAHVTHKYSVGKWKIVEC